MSGETRIHKNRHFTVLLWTESPNKFTGRVHVKEDKKNERGPLEVNMKCRIKFIEEVSFNIVMGFIERKNM